MGWVNVGLCWFMWIQVGRVGYMSADDRFHNLSREQDVSCYVCICCPISNSDGTPLAWGGLPKQNFG